MNEEDFKRLLNEALEPIKETQNQHTEILNQHTEKLNQQAEKLNSLWEQTVKLTENQTGMQEILNVHSKSFIYSCFNISESVREILDVS